MTAATLTHRFLTRAGRRLPGILRPAAEQNSGTLIQQCHASVHQEPVDSISKPFRSRIDRGELEPGDDWPQTRLLNLHPNPVQIRSRAVPLPAIYLDACSKSIAEGVHYRDQSS